MSATSRAGDTATNVEAFEKIVRVMHDVGVGYGAINHPVDRFFLHFSY